MARFYFLIGLISFLISSCAQVGQLTGGERDVTAPQPLNNKIAPENESVNFNASKIFIPFNEFIQLNNPRQNIVLIPPHAKVNAAVKGKDLTLNIEGDLKENTTYSIFLNNAIKDITEGNDSIMQYVFSTGPIIDSNTLHCTVIDAYSNKMFGGVYCALFDVDTDEIVNFSKTNSAGEVVLDHIKAGTYVFAAFDDKNLNLKVDPFEPVGFYEKGILEINENNVDSVHVRLFSPTPDPKIRTKTLTNNNTIIIGATVPFVDEEIIINGKPLSFENYTKLKEDSLLLFVPQNESNTIEVIIKSQTVNDTLQFTRKIGKEKMTGKLFDNTSRINPSNKVVIQFNDLIKSIDTSKIIVLNVADSSLIPVKITPSKNELLFDFNRANIESIAIKLLPGAVTGSVINSLEEYAITIVKERELGIINVTFPENTSGMIVNLLSRGKVIQSIVPTIGSSNIKIAELQPGEYTFSIIKDNNQNGVWDTGNYSEFIQPEEVIYYSTPTKIRANWEVEVTLE
jgi:uncharacterized protein (DUF2141 family)